MPQFPRRNHGPATPQISHELGSKSFKITVVGDGTVGKTCMLISYTKNEFPNDYIPTVFDNHQTTVMVDGVELTLTLWDTAGQEQYDRLRYLTYPKTDCFIICYSLEKKSSFDNVLEKWHPEIKRHCPNAAVILVGTKSDLKETSLFQLTEKQGKRMKSRIKAFKHIQCSAKNRENLEQVFIEAARSVVKKEKKIPCRIT